MTDGPLRRALLGALGLAFFGMPLPLTLLAWDLYGGFTVHLHWLVGLLAIGGVGGLAQPRVARWWNHARPAWVATAIPLVVFAFIAFLAARVLGNMALQISTRSEAELRPLGVWTWEEGAWLGAWTLATLRLGLTSAGSFRVERSAVLAGTWSLMAVAWACWAAGWLPRAVCGGALALAVAAAWTAPLWEIRLGPRAARSLRALPDLLFVAAYTSRFGRDLLPMNHALGIALTTSGGALAGGVLGWFTGGRPPLWDRLATAAGAAVVGTGPRLLLAALLVLLSFVLSVAVEPVGEVFAWTTGARGWLGFEDPAVVSTGADLGFELRALFALTLLRTGIGVTTSAGVRRFVGLSALVWCGLVAFQIWGLAPIKGLRFGLELVLVGLALVPWLPQLQGRLGRFEAAGLVLAPLLCGPLLGRYAAAAVPALGEPAAVAVAGMGVGAVLGGLLARRELRGDASAWGLIRSAGLGLLGLALVIYLAVFFALFAWRFVAVAGVLGLVVVGSRVLRGRGVGVPAIGLLPAVWLLFYVSFCSVVAFKDGPSPERCAEVHESTTARVLLRRFAEGGEYPSADPYDVLPDRTGRWLITTFKRFDDRGGFVEVIDVDEPTSRSRLMTVPPDGKGPLWPERFELDPQTGLLYFGMLGIDNYSLWEVAVRERVQGAAELEIVRTAPLAFEPSYPAIDLRRRRLVQPYLAAGVVTANQSGLKMPLVESVDLNGLYSAGRYRIDADSSAMSEYVAVDQRTGHYYVPSYFNLVRFALLELDGDTHTLRRKLETFHPTIGLVVDEDHRRLYVTNCVGGTLDAYDLDTWERVASVPSGAFPRDVAFHPDSGRLYVGNYSGGTVSVFETQRAGELIAPERVDVVEVGPVLRGIGIHRGSGRIYAASACGVYEVVSE